MSRNVTLSRDEIQQLKKARLSLPTGSAPAGQALPVAQGWAVVSPLMAEERIHQVGGDGRMGITARDRLKKARNEAKLVKP